MIELPLLEKSALAFSVDPTDLGLGAFPNLGALVTLVLPTIMWIAGMLLFGYLIMGGFKYLMSGGDDKAIMEGKKIITNAFLGMLIVFTSFWALRLVESLLGINVTGFN